MSEVKQKCQTDGCSRVASTRCYCCNTSVCTRHFNEHIDAVKAQVHPLADGINTMTEKIRNLSIEQLTEAPLSTLIKWRCDMYQLIDLIFTSKNKEIEELVEKNKEKFVEHKRQQWETIMKIQEDVKQLAEDGDATFGQVQLLKNQLACVETNLNSFRNDFISINVLMFGQGFVTVSSTLDKPSVIASTTSIQSLPPKQQPSINHSFGASTNQSSGFHGSSVGFQGTSPTNIFGSGVFSFGAGPTAPAFSGSSYLATTSVPETNRFSIGNESTNRRPVIKSIRRVKH